MATQTPSSSTNSQDTKKRKRDDSSCSGEDEKIITIYSPSSSTNSQSLPSLLYYPQRWLKTVINWIMSRDPNSSCSEEDENIITTFSPSSSTPRWKHDVFLSFCGKDTRKSFTDHLYVDLKRKGILVFRDDERLERGKCISQELLQAIKESQYAIVIFSANYASSKWCLMELAEIVDQWEKKNNLTIIPIFYHVDPSDIRNQRGSFAEAFAAHEKDPKVDIKEIDKWRNACRKVGKIAGEHVNGYRYESTIIQQVSGSIFYKYTMLNILNHDDQKLVGINSRVEEMMNLLAIESNDVRIVGLHGMGGVGKTTLAKLIYDRVSCQFEGRGFISRIREKSSARDLASLQKQLLSMIMQEKIRVQDEHEGITMIRSRMRNKKVFIVLDDVDSEKQLMALSGNQDCFGPGSRVIITCRDRHLLITHGVDDIYEVELLQTDDALQLFCLSAFKQTHPPENFERLSMDFVNYAGGLPLALEVLGSFLFGRTMDAWKSARDKLETYPNKEVMNILQISFDGLEESQQKLFLDLACFYFHLEEWKMNGHDLNEIYPDIDVEILVDKSLISESDDGPLVMHDLLREMGQKIVRRECPEEPGRRTRLFRQEDVFHVLKNDTGTDAIEVIALDVLCPKAEHGVIINAEAFSKIRKLRFLMVLDTDEDIDDYGHIEWCGNPLNYMPTDELRFLWWSRNPLRSWPTSFQPNNLTGLYLNGSRFIQLWNGSMVLDNLKYLDLSYSMDLIETPDLTGAPNLEKIALSGCRSLRGVHPSIGVLKRLEVLDFHNCERLTRLPDKFCLESLKFFRLLGCSRLVNFPDIQGDMVYLSKLNFSWEPTKKDLPSSFMSFSGLKNLYLSNCKNISIFPNVICSLSSLESLMLDGWSRLEKFPNLSMLERLNHLWVYGTAITQIPSVDMIPKSINWFRLDGRKRMRRKSRDLDIFINDCSLPKQSSSYPTYDIGSPEEYEMAGMLEVERLEIDFANNEKVQAMVQGWSLGSGIPEWVHNTSNGSSVKIELDGTMKGMDCAIFMVCDCYQFHSPQGTSVSLLSKESLRVTFNFCFETDGSGRDIRNVYYLDLQVPPSTDVCFGKQIVFWAYSRSPPWLPNNFYKRGFIKISITAQIHFEVRTHYENSKELEVKEWGMHLICPDDAGHGLGSDLDYYRQFYSAWNCSMTRNED